MDSEKPHALSLHALLPVAPTDLSATEARPREVARALAGLGWELTNVDRTPVYARVTACRGNRRVVLDLRRSGRSTLERFERAEKRVSTGRRGDRFVAHRLEDWFLGRTSYVDPPEALRGFVAYLAANGNGNVLPETERHS